MADSAKGKQSKHQSKYEYTVHFIGRTYSIYCPKRSAYIPSLEAYELLQNPKVRCFTTDGTDMTALMLKRVAKYYNRTQKAKKTKSKKEAALENESGYYCDCRLCNKYKHPSQVPKVADNVDMDKPGRQVKTIIDKAGNCAFCGYTAFYCEVKPQYSRVNNNKRSST